MTQATVLLQQIASFVLTEGLALAFVFLLVTLCNRRNSSDGRKGLKKARGVGTQPEKKENTYTSHGYRSSESTDIDSDTAVLSTSGSDKDSSEIRAERLVRPKGVEAKGFNKEAKPFVPRPVSKDNLLAERLHEITSSGGDAPSSLEEVLKRRLRREQSGHQKTDLPEGLKQVLGKLTPEDVAIVRAAFQAKQTAPQAPRFHRVANISEENTLRSNLRKLGGIDSSRVFMVRKLGKLGLNSPELLKTYFAKFGNIENVYVTHSIDRRGVNPDDPNSQPTVRPAGVGFIVMEKAEDVMEIFKQGLEHTISGAVIALTAYEHHAPDDVIRNEAKFGIDGDRRPRGPRFPTYANITEDNTLRANLRKMADIDAKRIFMVRKINKLGLGSNQLLKTHFGRFGSVTHVFVTHSIDRRKIDTENPNARPLVRPAGIGFVVMDRSEDVDAIFQSGMEQELYGVKICVAPYEHQVPEDVVTCENDQESPTQEDSCA